MPLDDPGPGRAFEALRRTQAITTCRLAVTAADRDAVFQLRHRAYLAEGAIEAQPDGRLHDSFDNEPHARIVMVHVGGGLAGTIRVHHLLPGAPRSSPALDAFADALLPLLRKSPSGIIDPDCFAICPEASRRHPGLAYLVLRAACMAAQWHDASHCTATVRREHQPFYRRVLRCKPLVAPRPYPGRVNALGLMVAEFRAEWPRVLARYPFFAPGDEDWGALFGDTGGNRIPAASAAAAQPGPMRR